MRSRRLCGFAAVAFAAFAPTDAAAQDAPKRNGTAASAKTPNNLPFSNVKGEGIENRIADGFGKALNLPVTYYSFPQRLAFIRNTLRYKLPGKEYPCDNRDGRARRVRRRRSRSRRLITVRPMPWSFQKARAWTTYNQRSTSSSRSGRPSWRTAHRPVRQVAGLRLAGSPQVAGKRWWPYPIMNPDPQQYPGEIIEKDLATGQARCGHRLGPDRRSISRSA